MTAHEVLNRRKRRVMSLIYGVVALHLTALIIGAAINQPFMVFVLLPAFWLAMIVAAWQSYRGYQCPWCRGNLAPLVYSRGMFSFDRRFLFCPYCAHRLDEELPEAEEVGAIDRT